MESSCQRYSVLLEHYEILRWCEILARLTRSWARVMQRESLAAGNKGHRPGRWEQPISPHDHMQPIFPADRGQHKPWNRVGLSGAYHTARQILRMAPTFCDGQPTLRVVSARMPQHAQTWRWREWKHRESHRLSTPVMSHCPLAVRPHQQRTPHMLLLLCPSLDVGAGAGDAISPGCRDADSAL